jgi:hypothetical protein
MKVTAFVHDIYSFVIFVFPPLRGFRSRIIRLPDHGQTLVRKWGQIPIELPRVVLRTIRVTLHLVNGMYL